MKRSLVLKPAGRADIVLRSVASDDAEALRRWKNDQREFFFFKNEISEEMQSRWMAAYLERENDYMFMVETKGAPVGCIGLRFEEDRGDIYNVILGDPTLRGQGVMSVALNALLTFGRGVSEDIGLKVLKANPAVAFYSKNGLVTVAEHDEYYEMRVDWSRFRPVVME